MVHSRELTSAIGMGAGVLAIGMVTERFAMGWRAAYVHVLDLGSHQRYEPARWCGSERYSARQCAIRLHFLCWWSWPPSWLWD